MADVELLPPPEKSEIDRHLPTGVRVYGYTSEDMHAYARANVAHATAPLQAEVEALRAEVDLRDSVIATHAADTREYQKRISQAEARAERLAEALQLALDSHGVTLLTDPPQDAWKARGVEAKARAALRDQGEG